jgi:hypothetical protein
MVMGRTRPKALSSNVMIACRVAGVRTFMRLKQFSPFFIKFRVIARTNYHLQVT